MRKSKVKQIAKTCYQFNKAYCESIGDFSQEDWDEAPDWKKESTIEGVQFLVDNPKVTPIELHDNWMKDKIKDGWKYGSVKSATFKTHPCMVSYQDLPKAQQFKDSLFQAVVKSYL